MKTRTIRQVVTFRATPTEVYQTLMTSRGHAGFTGASARVSPRVGGKFMAWGGYIHGTNLTLVPGRTIIQAWRPSDPTWPEDYYSKVRFDLRVTRGGTRLTFTHSGVPSEHVGHLATGWKHSYWDPLRKYFAKKPS